MFEILKLPFTFDECDFAQGNGIACSKHLLLFAFNERKEYSFSGIEGVKGKPR